MTNLNEICDLITSKYKIDYIIIDSSYQIQSFSQGVERFFEPMAYPRLDNCDIREIMYELIGYEKIIDEIGDSDTSSFYISTIYKNSYYIDVYIRHLNHSNEIAILIDDITVHAQKEQVILQDRNEKDLLVKELAKKNYLLNKYQKAAHEAIPILYLDAACQIVNINTKFLSLLGYARSKIKYQHFSCLIDPKSDTFDKDLVLKDMYQQKVHSKTLKLVTYHNKMLYVNAIFIPIFDEKERALKEMLLFADDITSHKKDNCQLQEIAYYDALTGVLNRIGLDNKINRLIQVHTPFVLMFLDLDFFKNVNDTHGHYYGDQLLQQVAKRLNSILNESDIIARYGGDEFVLIINSKNKSNNIETFAQEIVNSISKKYSVEDKVITIGVSIGIAYYPKDAMTKEQLIQQADKAMYDSKKKGRNQFSFHNF